MFMDSFIDLPPSLLRGIYGELEEIAYYEALARLATDEEDQKLVLEILDDERKHYNRFYFLYVKLTGNDPILSKGKEAVISSYIQGLQTGFLNEIKACGVYRDLYAAQKNTKLENTVFEAMTDESRHAAVLNFLYSKNKD